MSINSSRPAAMVAALTLLTGGKAPPQDFGPTLASRPLITPANGAIFQASGGYSALTSGARAGAVGDILTIALVERTQATKSATQTAGRDGSIGLNPPTSGPLALFSGSDVAMSGSQAFKGAGQAAQSNALTGEISVTVVAVYPNGTMLIRGEKNVTLNRGDETIRLSGLVRLVDIGPDNRIPSTRVADAKITYTGKGEVARASRQGWLQKVFSIVSPF
ncbi:flagellar basal body L-ring protein FlgH (plasmid) [Sphingomonas paeninsulae]|uniref:Flagellar L-ring protein n=2 Tax=Sphingomonas paeninsulae TaxID=2319844 RepID=A0A494THB1_SPHPE|nr:flagellar basal body L-ring protein FlgH [Sphingomonas paeninsulae]